MDTASLFTVDALIALATLTAMEIVLGIDNIVFIAILVGKLPAQQQPRARTLGLGLALVARLVLLFSITWVMGLTAPVLSVFGKSFSGRDMILLLGGIFLLGKATFEIHDKLEGTAEEDVAASGVPGRLAQGAPKFGLILLQIALVDIVFSIDSVITAVGMAQQIAIMVIAVVLAVGVMLLAARAISDFVHRHPTVKMLALSFLILIGMMLTVEGMGGHIEKGYVYFAMAFSLVVELLNIAYRKRREPVRLRHFPDAPGRRS